MSELSPMIKALRRHKVTVCILLLQFAVTFALLSNCTILVWQRFQAVRTPSGVGEVGLYVATSTPLPGRNPETNRDILRSATTSISRLSGVTSVSAMSQTPFSGADSVLSRISSHMDIGAPALEVSSYFADENMLKTLQLRLAAGRWFSTDEYSSPAEMPDAQALRLVVVTQRLATRLFPGGSALGKTIYSRGRPLTIVGILEHLARPIYLGTDTDDAMIFPVVPPLIMPFQIAVRLDAQTSSKNWGALLKDIESILASTFNGSLSWKLASFSKQRDELFASDWAAFRILGFMLLALLAVAVNAIAGLSYYWVNQRATHVAIRRALGALRRQVVTYFVLENLAINLAGILLGVLMTLSINTWLVLHYGVARLPVMPLIVGFVLVTVVGQIAVAYPAWKMGTLPPALASKI
jgi:putative ABC transport system permease protein